MTPIRISLSAFPRGDVPCKKKTEKHHKKQEKSEKSEKPGSDGA